MRTPASDHRRGYKFAAVYYREKEPLAMITFFCSGLTVAIETARDRAPDAANNVLVWATEPLGPPDPAGPIDVQEAHVVIERPSPTPPTP
jgi:hypothetical protein